MNDNIYISIDPYDLAFWVRDEDGDYTEFCVVEVPAEKFFEEEER